jgi:hypothetical protein
MEFIPHQLHLSPAQVSKIHKGLAFNLPYAQMGAEKGQHILSLLPATAMKMMKAYKSGKGMRLALSPEERQHSATHGRGIDVNKILNSPVGQKVIGKVVDKAIDKLVGGAVSFEKIMKSPVVQKIGDKVLDKAIDRALGGKLVKGSEEAKERMRKLREMRKTGGKASAYNTLVDIQKGLRAVGQPFERTIGVNPADIGEPIGEALGAELYKAVYGHPRGYGLGKKSGKGVKQSGAYKKAMKLNYGGVELSNAVSNQPLSKFKRDPRVKPSSDEMTLSPYQSISSPAMNPFVPKTSVEAGGTHPVGKGLYAGGLF